MFVTHTFEQFCTQYDNDENCISALFAARWPSGFSCPRCTHGYFYLISSRKIPLYECRSCHTQTSLIAGTIIEGSRTSLKKWLQAIYLHSQPEGLSAKHLASIIGTTYKTAWLICHKIRQAMSHADSSELLAGIVRVNWGNYGTPYNPTVFRHYQEQPLLVGASLDTNGDITHLKIKKVLDQHLQDNHITTYAGHLFKSKHVDHEATDVIVINQKFSRNRSKPLIRKCIQASQWINDIFKGIGPKHLQSYLDQFCYGFNHTGRSNQPFAALLHQCSITPVLTYPHLITRENHTESFRNRYLFQLSKVG